MQDRLIRLIIVWLPFAAVTAVIAAEIAALPVLPARVVIHWSVAGEPDGWGPAWGTIGVTAAIGYGTTALFAAFALFDLRSVNERPRPRFVAAMTWFIVGSAVPLLGATLIRQIWRPDAPAGTMMLAALATGVSFASLASTLLPSPLRERAAPEGEDLRQWNATTVAGRYGFQRTITAGLVGALAVATHALAMLEQPAWIVAASLLIVHAAAGPAALVVQVRIDARGLLVRSPIGIPRVSIPLHDIADAGVIEVDPAVEIGKTGWNARSAGPQAGVAIRSGEGIRIRRADGSRFVVATDDAAAGLVVLRAQLAADRAARAHAEQAAARMTPSHPPTERIRP